MNKEASYFNNLDITMKFPYSLYHGPINQELMAIVETIEDYSSCLNVGCGHFNSYYLVKKKLSWSVFDLDSRSMDLVIERNNEVQRYSKSNSYDFIFAKEVIEHVIDSQQWLQEWYEKVNDGGTLYITTPNYGVSILPIIEYTILEVIARFKGFSRFDIHPNKFNWKKLQEHVLRLTPAPKRFEMKKLSCGMVLAVKIVK